MKKLPLSLFLAVLCGAANATDYVSTDVTGKVLSSTVSNPVESIVTVSGVPENHEISLLKVKLSITHTYVADLDIYLVDPGGNEVELTTDNGSGGNNFTNTVFVQSAASSITSVTSANAPFTGDYRPEGNLESLYQNSANGSWTLRITDDAGGDEGTLDAWTLTLESESTVPPEPKVTSRPVVVEMNDCPSSSYSEHTFSLFKKVVFRDSLRESPLGNGGGIVSLVSKKAGAWTNGEFSSGYAVFFLKGAQQGRLFPIVHDSNGVLSISSYREDLTQLAEGDDYEVVELWSLNSLIPSGIQTAIDQTTAAAGDSRLLLKPKAPYRTEGMALYANSLGDIWSTQQLNLTKDPYLYLAEEIGVLHTKAGAPTRLVILGTPVSSPFIDDLDDSDGDSLSDAWEVKYSGSLSQLGAVADADSDNDGFLDVVEQRLGFSPLDSNHRFRVSSAKVGANHLQLGWKGMLGQRYKIETSKNLVSWSPSNLGEVVATSADVSVQVDITQGESDFYRVIEVTN